MQLSLRLRRSGEDSAGAWDPYSSYLTPSFSVGLSSVLLELQLPVINMGSRCGLDQLGHKHQSSPWALQPIAVLPGRRELMEMLIFLIRLGPGGRIRYVEGWR